MTGNYEQLRGKGVYYESVSAGSERSVLLLHGMRFSSSEWVHLDALRKISQWGFNVVAVDYPGFGKSETNPEYGLSGEDYSKGSAFVSDFCDAVSLQKVTLIGPSMGGAITIRAATDNIGVIDSVIVVAPAGFSGLRERLSRIEIPVHIVWGSDDNVIDLSYGRRYHDLIAGSTLNVIRGAGHPVYLDKVAQFFSLIRKFLEDGS